MSAYAWAIRPNGLAAHRGQGALHGLAEVLREVWEVLAFAYRLRSGSGVRRSRVRHGPA